MTSSFAGYGTFIIQGCKKLLLCVVEIKVHNLSEKYVQYEWTAKFAAH
jgi:hypothetical protein